MRGHSCGGSPRFFSVGRDGGQRIVYEAPTEQGDWEGDFHATDRRLAGPHRAAGTRSISCDLAGWQGCGDGPGTGWDFPVSGKWRPTGCDEGAPDTELPIRLANGGKSLLVSDATGHQLVLTPVDPSTGRRQPWKRVATESHADRLSEATPDLNDCVYPFPHYSSVPIYRRKLEVNR